ncbi:DUF3945 domain-containing protein [Chryseobacterium sp. Ch-15]|uniref:DUF3945 domain-containing protein n=1 Tax=Chryseobacterium muglaense TaxID=2893752 RepID=A0A9Q3UR21_9FLAO|nr:DUF3945 domain-containing protein [Chryseobacterium muglaense]MBD3907314.1 DUF3945 domain-containing protein [Chryseobacterium muglaense]MCC9033032.1 DUF3945 domain-containing protein [Chryseobacterium muglaense]MCM2556935.1 DUF3945 domain-containing protein [Chryseobacterium muglaense]
MNNLNVIGTHTAVSELSTLLVLRHSNNSIGIVQDVNEQGNLIEIVPDQNGVDKMICIDSSADSFMNFYADFYHQLKDPADYSFFKVREYEARETAISLQRYVELSSDNERKDLKEYEVSIETVESFRNKNYIDRESCFVNDGFHNQSSEISVNSTYRFQIEDVPWERLNEIGVDREKLERIGALDSLLKGYKTRMLIPILLNGGNSFRTVDARLQLRLDNSGEVVVCIHQVQDRPDFNQLYFGHQFTKADEINLLKFGNMGRVVELVDERTGELIPSLISMDRLTNELISLRMDFVRIPLVICGVTLSLEQRKILRVGKRLFIENMLSKRGSLFSATVQFNAEKQWVEFLFEKNLKRCKKVLREDFNKEVPVMFRGKYLRQWQMKKLKAGESAYISGLVSDSGKKYQGYIRFDKESGRILFSFKNPMKKSKVLLISGSRR